MSVLKAYEPEDVEDNKGPFAAYRREERKNFGALTSPRCPHCGEFATPQDHDNMALYGEGRVECCCPVCGEDFTVYVFVELRYTTKGPR